MKIYVLGKPGCSLCDAAKEKLEILGRPYRFIDLNQYMEELELEGWRGSGITDALSAAIVAGIDIKKVLPVIVINNVAHTYSAAMKVLHKKGKGARHAN